MKRYKNKMKIKKGMISAIATVVLMSGVAVGNIIVTQKDYKVDFTNNKLYSLSKESNKILDSLDKKVTIYVINSKSETNNDYKRIFQCYQKKDRVSVKYIDSKLYPKFVQKYVNDDEEVLKDSAIVVCGNKYRYIPSSDYVSYSYDENYTYQADAVNLEKKLTEAINYVVDDYSPIVYTLAGHSEKEFSSEVVSSFETDNYSVKSLDLTAKETVPKDCEILLINGPQKDISKAEKKALEQYMQENGKMYVTLDAGVEDLPNFYAFLNKYNVGVVKGVVIESDSNMYMQYPFYLLPQIENTKVTASQYNKGIYILAISSKGLEDLSSKKNNNQYKVESLLKTGKKAYSKTDTTSSTYEKEKKDINGPFSIAVSVSDKNGGRMIVTGCNNMLEGEVDEHVNGANTDFVLNGINYMTKQQEKISISSKKIEQNTITVPAYYQKMLTIMIVFAVPLVLLLVGIAVVLHRRRL